MAGEIPAFNIMATVKMTRGEEMADVHPDEVDNWAQHGWVKSSGKESPVESEDAPPPKAKGRPKSNK